MRQIDPLRLACRTGAFLGAALAIASGVAIAAASLRDSEPASAVPPGGSVSLPASARGLLFRIDKSGVPASWIFGTIHSADPRVTTLPAAVMQAIARSRTYAPEIVLSDGDLAGFFAGAQQDDGRRIGDLFSSDTIGEIHAALRGSGLSDEVIERLKPWAILLKLAEGPPAADATAGTLDQQLLTIARSRRMSIVGLEMPEEQQSAFDTIPESSQVALVRFVLANREALLRQHEEAIGAWRDRDLARLVALSGEPGRLHPEIAADFAALNRQIVVGRSALMAHRLFIPLSRGRVFVAVGALHLPGPEGLLALLAEQGYRIRRLY